MAESQPARPPPRFGNYEIISMIGRGGMADVFKARAVSGPHAGQLVAIKRLLPDLAKDQRYLDLFLGEADLSRLLQHPNIIQTYDAGELNGTYYIAMELIDGRDLGQVLARCRERNIQLPVDFAMFLASKVLAALYYAHNAKSANGTPLNLIHSDVSPSNVFVSRTGQIRLGDFGIAKARVASAADEGVRGKLFYLSPETLDGKVTVGTDLWAMNVTLYELLTCWKPFGGTSPEAVEKAVRNRDYMRASEVRPDVPAAVDEIIARGFAADPAKRHQTALEFAEDLAPHYDERVGTDLAIAAVVRGLFGA